MALPSLRGISPGLVPCTQTQEHTRIQVSQGTEMAQHVPPECHRQTYCSRPLQPCFLHYPLVTVTLISRMILNARAIMSARWPRDKQARGESPRHDMLVWRRHSYGSALHITRIYKLTLRASEISSRKVWQVPYMALQPLRGASTTTCEPGPKSVPEAEKPFLPAIITQSTQTRMPVPALPPLLCICQVQPRAGCSRPVAHMPQLRAMAYLSFTP